VLVQGAGTCLLARATRDGTLEFEEGARDLVSDGGVTLVVLHAVVEETTAGGGGGSGGVVGHFDLVLKLFAGLCLCL
jgi:hypothetical protein